METRKTASQTKRKVNWRPSPWKMSAELFAREPSVWIQLDLETPLERFSSIAALKWIVLVWVGSQAWGSCVGVKHGFQAWVSCVGFNEDGYLVWVSSRGIMCGYLVWVSCVGIKHGYQAWVSCVGFDQEGCCRQANLLMLTHFPCFLPLISQVIYLKKSNLSCFVVTLPTLNTCFNKENCLRRGLFIARCQVQCIECTIKADTDFQWTQVFWIKDYDHRCVWVTHQNILKGIMDECAHTCAENINWFCREVIWLSVRFLRNQLEKGLAGVYREDKLSNY